MSAHGTGSHASARLFVATAVVFAGFVAASLAHVAIDVVGDFALARDAYDGMDHAARLEIVPMVAFVALCVATCGLWLAVLDGGRGRAAVRTFLGPLASRRTFGFVAATAIVAVGTLVAMEAVDTLAQRGAVDDLADLLGGSILLGLALVIPIATLVAYAVRFGLEALLRSCRDLVVLGARILAQLIERRRAQRLGVRPRTASVAPANTNLRTHATGKRAPPALAG